MGIVNWMNIYFTLTFFGVQETRNRSAKYGVSVRDIEKENCPLIYWWHMAIQLLASNNRVDEFFATYLVVFCISEKKNQTRYFSGNQSAVGVVLAY